MASLESPLQNQTCLIQSTEQDITLIAAATAARRHTVIYSVTELSRVKFKLVQIGLVVLRLGEGGRRIVLKELLHQGGSIPVLGLNVKLVEKVEVCHCLLGWEPRVREIHMHSDCINTSLDALQSIRCPDKNS